MKYKLLLLAPLALLLIFAGCQSEKKSSLQILRLGLYDDPVSFDPRLVRTLKDLTLAKQLFEGLMRLDKQGVPQLALADHVDLSPDLLTYTFHLRSAFWSNGEPVTAYDFEYSWKKVLDPTFASDYAYMLYPIKNARCALEGKCDSGAIGIKAIDHQTFQVILHTATPYFLELTAFPTYFPVNHNNPPSDKALVCNGPFALKKWVPQSDLILEKNHTYWDAGEVFLDQIVFSVIADNNTESQLFEKNELDWLGQPISNNVATETLGELKKSGSLQTFTVAGTLWFEFNTEKLPLNDVKIRKALAYAVNRQEIIEHILQGNQEPATGPLPPSMAVNTEPYFLDGDQERARQLFQSALQQNNWENEFPEITLTFHSSERNLKIAQLVQQQWKQVLGIDVQLESIERGLYRRNIRQGLYQIGIGEWIADFNDPIAFLELFKYKNDNQTGSGMNGTQWQNSDFIALLDLSMTECDPIKRGELLGLAEKVLMEDMPISPLYHYAFDYVKKPYVENVFLSPLGHADFKSARIVHLGNR